MKNKNIAARTLAAVFVLFCAAAVLNHYYRGVLAADFFYAAAEAALVGGIADWFAVTALFRKPLGFPWHTRIIPRNRERLVQAVARAVEDDLLNADSLKKRIEQVQLVDSLLEWMEQRNGRLYIHVFLTNYAQRWLQSVEPEKVAGHIEAFIRRNAPLWPIGPSAGRLAGWLQSSGRLNAGLDYLLAELENAINQPAAQEKIYLYLVEYRNRKANSRWKQFLCGVAETAGGVDLVDAAAVLQRELLALVRSVQQPHHPAYRLARRALGKIAAGLSDDPRSMQAVEAWKNGLIAELDIRSLLGKMLAEALTDNGRAALYDWGARQAARFWQRFKRDRLLQSRLEWYGKEIIYNMIETEHHFIGAVVTNALNILTDEDLNQFVEDKAGDDLQWIRINGSVIGGLAGSLLFLFGRFIYGPWLAPAVRSWFG